MARREAIIHAGPVRMRPILMTTFAMVFGMLPVALGFGEGAETALPMGIAVIGGLLTSLFLTLVVVPAAYDQFDDWKEYVRNWRRKRRPAEAEDEENGQLVEVQTNAQARDRDENVLCGLL